MLDWVNVCVTNKSEVEVHMLDREMMSAFGVFLGNLPRKEELLALVGWRMVYSTMQVLAAEGSTIGETLTNHILEARFGTLQVFFRLYRRCMMDTVTWTAGQLKS